MSEFKCYDDHALGSDMENCGACVLLASGNEGPNYAGWPLAFLQAGRAIPFKYKNALVKELNSTNTAYVKNLKTQLDKARFEWRGLVDNEILRCEDC